MNKLQDIITFFNELRLNAGAIWQEKDAIKFSAPKKFQSQETDDFIRSNKSLILLLLKENEITSKEKFQHTIIFRGSSGMHYPLSPAQERLWFIEQYEGGTNAYHIPEIYEVEVYTNVEALKYAIQQVVSRHEVLRSTIEDKLGSGIQVVHNTPLVIEEIKVNNTENHQAMIREDMNRPFDLKNEYPIRVKFYILKATEQAMEKTLLLINTHHIASDGWSMEVFQKELLAYYEAYVNKDLAFSLPALEIQYKDYAVWQRSYLSGEVLTKQLEYWKNKLTGYQTLEFPVDYARPSQVDYKGAHHSFSFNKQLSQKLRTLAQRYAVTLNSLMLSAVNILLNKYTGQNDIVVGSVIANRHHRQTKGLIGFFINTQANRTLLKASQSFADLMQQVHQEQVEAQLHQDLPFEKLVDALGVERDSSRHPVFQVMFTMEGFGTQDNSTEPEKNYLSSYSIDTGFEVEKFDFSIYINDGQDELIGQIGYSTSLFNKTTITRLADHFTYLLTQLTKAPDQPYSKISLLNAQEYEQLIYAWNATSKVYPKDKTIQSLFQEQAQLIPDNIALVVAGKELSYKELNEKSNQLAHYIRKQYQAKTKHLLAPDSFIALYLDRSLEMVIGILAVLKAGAAYVPIDPAYPQSRIDYMLEDTQAALILTQQHLASGNQVQLPTDKLIRIDLQEDLYSREEASDLPSYNTATDLAYVIYTSGTTGRPKGVLVEHHQVISFAKENNFIAHKKTKTIAGVSNYAFDGSVFDLFYTFINGQQLVLIDKDCLLDITRLDAELIKLKVDTVFITTALFNSLVQHQAACLNTLQQILFGGERCNLELINKFKNLYPHTTLIHVYGPTENIVYSTSCNLSIYPTNAIAPIGTQLSDKKLYVLNPDLSPVPIGLSGELYIGGAGVARGYLNRPDLTDERFVLNPFATEEDKLNKYTRLYKTGDLVRRLPDGNIEYIGRNDDQVKIRGHRIELGEIENVLAQLEGIEQACVLVKERTTATGNTNYVVAYYVADNKQGKLTQAVLHDQLTQVLPEYMIPAALIAMETFPLTSNGKLDKRALPDPDFNSPADEYVAPTTETETMLCNIWKTVLGLQKVSCADNFFRIGGDSILSIQVSGRIRQAGFACQVKDIFECKTIAKLAEHLSKKSSALVLKTEQGMLTGELGLLPVQQWFVAQVEQGDFTKPNHFNHSFLVKVPGLDIKKLETAIAELVDYHDVLRIRYTKEQEAETGKMNWKQVYQSNIVLPELKTLDVSKHTSVEIHERLTEWQGVFDLEQGILFQVAYLYGYEDGSARIFFALHHLIVDGVSWRILAEDVKLLYEGKTLAPKGSSYRQWVETVSKYPEQHPEEASYWQEQLKGMPAYRIAAQQQEAGEEFFELDKELTRSLIQEASRVYHTEVNDLLLTALAYALKEINHNTIQGITLEGHGREDIDAAIDHSRTTGWFTTMFPVKLELQNTLKESIQFIKESLRNIPNKGIGFGAFASAETSSYTFNDLAPVSFNYLGQFDQQEQDWQIVSEDSGNGLHSANKDHNLLTINGMVSDGQLGFTVQSKLGMQLAKQLSDSFEMHLKRLIQHCNEKLENKEFSYTPGDFKWVRMNQQLLDQLTAAARSNQNELIQIYPANSLQQGFIYHVLSRNEDDAYRVQVLFDYHEALNIALYVKAWEYCITQYPILRTAFNWEEEIVQLIYKYGQLNYRVHDISGLNTQEERDAAIEAIRVEDRKQAFDLTQPTLLRLHIIKQTATCYTVLKNVHHSIADGWSESVLLASLHRYYQELLNNKIPKIKEDMAYLQSQEYICKHKSTIHQYWKTTLAGIESANDINALLCKPIDPGNYKQVEQSAANSIEFTGDFYNQLKTFINKEGITSNVLLQFAWHKLLHVYSNRLISIVGTTVSGRDIPIEGIEESVGLYINTLPLVIEWENENSILLQLQQIQQKLTELNTHGFAELAKLQKDGERIFHSLFVYENYPASEEDESGPAISLRNVTEKGNYPLGITGYEQAGSITIKLKYDAAYLTEDKAQELLARLEYIIHQVIINPGKKHGELTLLSPEEHQQLVYQWNDQEKAFQQDKTIHQLFEEQAALFPDNIALVYEGQKLSYKELNEKSNQLAHYIRKQYLHKTKCALAPDMLIGLCLDRSLEMVLGMLAVLKAGGAYVPIDPRYPQERIDYLLQDTRAEIILSQRQLSDAAQTKLPQDKIIHIDLAEELYTTTIKSNLVPQSTAGNLAYVIYTSGTSGKPKGVMVEHDSAVYYLLCFKNIIQRDHLNVFAVLNYCFDASLPTLLSGAVGNATTHIAANNIFLSQGIEQYIQENKIDTIRLTPSMLESLDLSGVQQELSIVMGGEKISFQCVNAVIANQHIRLYNQYGPTEATVGTTVYRICEKMNQQLIGKPYPGKRVFVLDQFNQPVPAGVVGELYIGGAGLSRGYLNRADLTTERFVANPFATEADKAKSYTRLYKTGDLVRWLPDGNLEYIGRNDEQVKVRGYRIELGEIEHALLQVKGIRAACVMAKQRKTEAGTSSYLVAYYVSDNTIATLNAITIKEKLAELLPDYMVPGAFIELEFFPLTANGKLDKRALPDPELSSSLAEYVAPTNEIEATICKVWKALLGLEKIGITDDFFRIGGDSILSIQVAGRLRQAGYSCQVKDVFEYKTIARLAEHLSQKNLDISLQTEQGALSGELDFLPIQQWFVEQVEQGELPEPNYFNHSFLIKVPVLDPKKLKMFIVELAAYHDVLRVRYYKERDVDTGEINWKQAYQPDIAIPELKILDRSIYTEMQVQELLGSWQSNFDLEQGPLFQSAYLYGYEDGSARIFFALHHLIVDAVSWRILAEDIKTLCEGKKLPVKGSSYRQWVKVLKAYPQQHPAEAAYWEEQLKDVPNYQEGKELQEPSEAFFELNKELTRTFIQEAPKAYHTEVNDLLLTAFAYALKDMNHNDTQAITLEGHGREDIDASIDHSRTIGWFTTKFPVKLNIQNNLKESIQLIKESLRNIPNKGIGFGAFAAKKESNYSHRNLAPVSFNYLGQFENKAGDWQIVQEESGNMVHAANTNPILININGMVSQGKLGFSIVTRLGAKTTQQLNNSFELHLRQVIQHCSEKLEQEGSTYTPADFKAFIPYEIINEQLDEDPVILFPPGNGGAESYYNSLVPVLKAKKLILFNNFYSFMKDRDANYYATETFEGLAKYYKLLIQKLQPKGNYTFAGWSFGGLLAFEVFRQLSVKGTGRHNLILLDSSFVYKQVEEHIPQQYLATYRDNIHYRYQPTFNQEDLNIVLFKCSKTSGPEEKENKEAHETLNTYVDEFRVNSAYNGLDTVLEGSFDLTGNRVQVIQLDCHHDNILETHSETISNYILAIQDEVNPERKELQEQE